MNGEKKMSSRNRIMLAVWGMLLAMIGDYLLGAGTFGQSSDPGAYLGITWNVVPDWRYAASSVLGFIAAALFAGAAVELMRVMENKYSLGGYRIYRLFRLANWSGILFFAFIHIGICMLPVVFNAGMAAVNDVPTAAGMTLRVAKSIIIPLGVGFILCDLFATVGWIGMVARGLLPVKKIALICNPLVIALLGQALNFVPFMFEGADSGAESFGWLLMYLVCALRLVDKGERDE